HRGPPGCDPDRSIRQPLAAVHPVGHRRVLLDPRGPARRGVTSTAANRMPGAAALRRPASVRTLWLLAGVGAIIVLSILSVSFGVRAVSVGDILAALSGH